MSRVRGLGRVEPSQGLEVESSRVRGLGRAEPSQGLRPSQVRPSRARSRDAGGLDLGLEGLYWELVRDVWSGCGNRMHCL